MRHFIEVFGTNAGVGLKKSKCERNINEVHLVAEAKCGDNGKTMHPLLKEHD